MKQLKCLGWLDCKACGARNYGMSKHRPKVSNGKHWCGHCGGKLEKAK